MARRPSRRREAPGNRHQITLPIQKRTLPAQALMEFKRRFHIWEEQRFESALHLTRAPDSASERRIQVHSNRLHGHLAAPLDEVMGRVLDYRDVRKRSIPSWSTSNRALTRVAPTHARIEAVAFPIHYPS